MVAVSAPLEEEEGTRILRPSSSAPPRQKSFCVNGCLHRCHFREIVMSTLSSLERSLSGRASSRGCPLEAGEPPMCSSSPMLMR